MSCSLYTIQLLSHFCANYQETLACNLCIKNHEAFNLHLRITFMRTTSHIPRNCDNSFNMSLLQKNLPTYGSACLLYRRSLAACHVQRSAIFRITYSFLAREPILCATFLNEL